MEGTVHVLDGYYLAITLLITIVYQLFFFSIAFTFKFDKLTGIPHSKKKEEERRKTEKRFDESHRELIY